jgi:hypothetical protein
MMHATHVVVDTHDGCTWFKDADGALFTLDTATRFAEQRNAEMKPQHRTYQVFALSSVTTAGREAAPGHGAAYGDTPLARAIRDTMTDYTQMTDLQLAVADEKARENLAAAFAARRAISRERERRGRRTAAAEPEAPLTYGGREAVTDAT